MRLIRFLAVVEKIIIIIIVLCFIPIALFVYMPQKIVINPLIISNYNTVRKQSTTPGFILGLNPNVQCATRQKIALMNDYCMDRCEINKNCWIIAPSTPCQATNEYIIAGNKFCSISPIGNRIINSDTPTIVLDNKVPPLASIAINSNDTALVPQYYCIKNIEQCKILTKYFGHDVQQKFDSNYDYFESAVTYLMYYALIPLIIHIIIVLILDSCFKFNLRLTNSLMVVHVALVGAGIIVCGIIYNLTNDQLADNISHFSSDCLMNDFPICEIMSGPFSTFINTDGVSHFFTIFMGFIMALQILCLLGIIVVNVLMVKYWHLRDIDPMSSGYQLQPM